MTGHLGLKRGSQGQRILCPKGDFYTSLEHPVGKLTETETIQAVSGCEAHSISLEVLTGPPEA